jgi:hypothetical protein
MKRIFPIFLCTILFACRKDKIDNSNTTTLPPAPSANGSMQYRVNGNLIKMENGKSANGDYVICSKQLSPSSIPMTYLLSAQTGLANYLTFTIVTDSLHTINYHYDSAFKANNFPRSIISLNYNIQSASVFFSGDYMDINISSYDSGRISGTFTAKLSPFGQPLDYSRQGTLVITEGVINNVPIIY